MARPSRALVALLLVLGLAGCGDIAAPGIPSPIPGTSSAPAPAAKVATPTAVAIPRIGAQSSLVSTGLNPDGTVEVPDVHRPGQASYYRLGPTPGARGPALVLGHVNGDGKQGVFARLHELRAGDQVNITTTDGVVRFAVYQVKLYDKTAFPWAQVMAQTPGPELRLVTCGGVLDRAAHSYLSNWVVYARKV